MGEADTEERRKALEKKFAEKRPPLAYAKLSGRVLDDQPFEALVTHLPVLLGRGPVGAAAAGHIHLGEQKSISRLHARVQWNSATCCFEVLCLGKNGMFAAGKFVPKDQTVALSSKMPLKIGGARVYFVAALRSTCSTMSGSKMVHKAFEKARTAKGVTSMTASDVCRQVLELFPRSEAELGGLDNLHSFVTEYLRLDSQDFEPVGSEEPPRYTMKAGSSPAVTKDVKDVGPALAGSEAPSKKQKTVK